MKQRFRNIFDLNLKKRGTSIIIAVLIIVLISTSLAACTTSNTTTSPSTDMTETASPPDTSAVTDTAAVTDSADTSPWFRDLAGVSDVGKAWAEAVKNRDGKAQYALMTKALQEKVYNEFTGLNWVIGTSSPWVVSYDIPDVESRSTDRVYARAKVIFQYATSTGPAGSYSQELTFIEEDGALKIDSISELQDIV